MASIAIERIPSPLATRQCTRKPGVGRDNYQLLTHCVHLITHRVHRGRKVHSLQDTVERQQEDRLASAAAASGRHNVGNRLRLGTTCTQRRSIIDRFHPVLHGVVAHVRGQHQPHLRATVHLRQAQLRRPKRGVLMEGSETNHRHVCFALYDAPRGVPACLSKISQVFHPPGAQRI